MNTPKISVIMPAYNAEAFLHRSIDSVIQQAYQNWELLIVDDGSTDCSVEICHAYEKQDSRIRLLCNQHGGTARARNTAIDQAQGEYIAFIDADDVYHPQYMQNMMCAALKENADIVICGIERGTDCTEFLRKKIRSEYTVIGMESAFARMYGGEWEIMIAPVNKLYARKVFFDVHFPAGRFFEDAATTNLALCRAVKIAKIDDMMYFYYITPNSSSVTKRSIELQDREWALRSHWEYFFAQGREDLAYLSLPFYLVELISIYHRIARSDKPKDCELIRKRFEMVYKTYRKKIIFTEKQKDQILAFRHPTMYDIQNMIHEHGIIHTLFGFILRKYGKLLKKC